MASPHDCPLPVGQACPHNNKLSETQSNLAVILDRITEIKEDMREIKQSVADIPLLKAGQATQEKSLDRVFRKLEELEDRTDAHESTLDQFRGMKTLAVGLWSLLAGGLALVIVRVFEVIK